MWRLSVAAAMRKDRRLDSLRERDDVVHAVHDIKPFSGQELLNVRTAVRANLPVGIKRTLARRAHVAHLRVAHRAHHKVLLDGRAAVGARAVLGKLTLTQGHVELLLLTIRAIAMRTKGEVGDEPQERDERQQTPGPEERGAATIRIDEHVEHRKDIERHNEANEAINGRHQLRRQKFLDERGHGVVLSTIAT